MNRPLPIPALRLKLLMCLMAGTLALAGLSACGGGSEGGSDGETSGEDDGGAGGSDGGGDDGDGGGSGGDDDGGDDGAGEDDGGDSDDDDESGTVGTLVGRSWESGQLLETGDGAVVAAASGMDAVGRATVVFAKEGTDGTGTRLYVVNGRPNAKGSAAVWSSPEEIGSRGGENLAHMRASVPWVDLEVTPEGNALAMWAHVAPCTTTTYIADPDTDCTYLVTARYLSAAGEWEAPIVVADVPLSGVPQVYGRVNATGDTALQMAVWERDGGGFLERSGVALRPAGATGYAIERLDDGVESGNLKLFVQPIGLDDNGNVLVAGEVEQAGTTDIVAYRGTVAGGLSAPAVVDKRGDRAFLQSVGVSADGGQIVVWAQSNGATIGYFAATSATPDGDFDLVDLNVQVGANYPAAVAVVDTEEQGWLLYNGYEDRLSRFEDRAWAPAAETGWSAAYWIAGKGGASRAGFLGVHSADGLWSAFDQVSGTVLDRTGGGDSAAWLLLGVEAYAPGVTDVSVSDSGVGVAILINSYDSLPSADSPMGERRTVQNLWAVYLK